MSSNVCNTPPEEATNTSTPSHQLQLIDALGSDAITSNTGLNTAMQELRFIVSCKIHPATDIYEWMRRQQEDFITYMQDEKGIWKNYHPLIMALLDEITPYKAHARELLTEAH